ncbi:MAG: alanine racemase [Pseudomonadota bacterium]
MGTAHLTINLGALVDNWRALDSKSGSGVETAAVVKADGYGLGSGLVSDALAKAGARKFFVAVAEEGAAVRKAVGPDPWIGVFGGHMAADAAVLRDNALVPMLNSPEQIACHRDNLAGHPFGVQLDSGMNRLGLEPADWAALRDGVLSDGPDLVMSHLANADEPDHWQNAKQLDAFREMTSGLDVPLSLSATGGILLGADYHFDVTRPGIGIYGGLPFDDARAVVRLSIPVIQIRDLEVGETVGYGATWVAERPSRIATISAGYADGLIRAMSGKATLWAGDTPCPLAGRVSMDLLTVDVTDAAEVPETLALLTDTQTVDGVADAAGTIGYEVLTSLGGRYQRTVQT